MRSGKTAEQHGSERAGQQERAEREVRPSRGQLHGDEGHAGDSGECVPEEQPGGQRTEAEPAQVQAEQPGQLHVAPAEARGVDEHLEQEESPGHGHAGQGGQEMTAASGQQQRREPEESQGHRVGGQDQRVRKPPASEVDHGQRYPDPGQVAERGERRARPEAQRHDREGQPGAEDQDPRGPPPGGLRAGGLRAGGLRAGGLAGRGPASRRAACLLAARPVNSPATTAAATVAPSAAFTSCPGSLA